MDEWSQRDVGKIRVYVHTSGASVESRDLGWAWFPVGKSTCIEFTHTLAEAKRLALGEKSEKDKP